MKKIVLAITIFISINSFTQNDAQNQLGAWYMYGGSHKISDNWSIKSLAHFRFFEIADDLQQLLIRAGANYKINNTFNVTLGYAYLNTDGTYNTSNGQANEHRVYEDFNIKHKLSKLNFAHRFRLEHRFFETETTHWIRYQLGLSYPISEKWATYFFDEVFLNFQGDTFAQNWIGAGLTYKVSDLIKLKAGYMNIQQNSTDFDRIQLGIILSTNHQKKN